MDVKYNHEKILIIVALIFCAGILFYNAFFIPNISIPSVIYVNTSKETAENSENDENSVSNSLANSSNQKLNINTATADELDEKLSGIGPVIAKRIIEYRNSVGKFNSIEEIKNVSGIGDKTFENFKDMICV